VKVLRDLTQLPQGDNFGASIPTVLEPSWGLVSVASKRGQASSPAASENRPLQVRGPLHSFVRPELGLKLTSRHSRLANDRTQRTNP